MVACSVARLVYSSSSIVASWLAGPIGHQKSISKQGGAAGRSKLCIAINFNEEAPPWWLACSLHQPWLLRSLARSPHSYNHSMLQTS